MWKRATAAIVATAVAMTCTTLLQRQCIHPRTSTEFDEDLLYLPNDKLLENFTGGLSSVIADLLWIKTINYAAREFRSKEKKFTWLEQMVRAVVQLDPYYEAAYSTGGIMLSALGQDDRSLELLQEGIVRRPESFDIAFELVSIYLLNRRHQPGAAALTLQYMPLVAANSDRPDYYLDWMDRIRMNDSLEGEARRVWEDLLENATDDFIRELALTQLTALDAEETARSLNGAIPEFEERFGRVPESIEELAASNPALEPDLTGRIGTFYLDPNGKVRNSIVDAKQIDRYVRQFRRIVNSYKRRHGAFPESFDVLETVMKNDPSYHPVPGHTWGYDPETGLVYDVPPGGPVRQ